MALDPALRKRQQISKANRTMFLWVAGVSAIVGIAVVVSIFLSQKLMFNEKVLGEKGKTVDILKHNNSVVDELKKNVRVLNTNQALIDSRAAGEDEPVQVVLDALPSDANSSALGASLQENLLKAPDITIESLVVDPVFGVESNTESNTSSSSSSAATGNVITFRFSVSTQASKIDALKTLLQRLESSIRTIDITKVVIETQGSRAVLSADGVGYYEPAKTVELKEKTVRPQ